uniref:Uncharacterized protein n=1 Tax=Podoviridae sp. ct8Lf7 TaxID=2827723 RepID=A0A8S5S1A5_9CAUD|nr:MAG TPA: hypothetical protein [Podoviridae sp. ct8Lf7]
MFCCNHNYLFVLFTVIGTPAIVAYLDSHLAASFQSVIELKKSIILLFIPVSRT